jgi:type II secretory pathway component PulF
MTTISHARQAVADAAARAEFYRLWHAGQRMGATNAHILEMMGPRATSAVVEQLRMALLEGAQQRAEVTAVVAANPKLVQPFEGALLSFGEESGSLEQSLKALIAHFKAEHRMLVRIWSSLTYPLITSLAMIFIAPLPLLAAGQGRAYLISVGVGVARWYGLGGGVIVALAASYSNRRDFVLARLARAMAAGVEAGLPLDRVVVLSAEATGHPQIKAHVARFSARDLATQPLSETFAGCAVIPGEMAAAMHVAEASGDFSGSLRKLADLYDSGRSA